MFTAMRRASSRVNGFAAADNSDRRPPEDFNVTGEMDDNVLAACRLPSAEHV
jgi:hypothetical protein